MVANGPKAIAILGPTCTGKSDLALRLAEPLRGEIVNADSMQVYRHFDIGTAKPSPSVRARIPHHVIDVAWPDEEFNAAMFQKAADHVMAGIAQRGGVPLVVGGTGLYLRVLFYGIFEAPQDPAVREELRRRYREDPTALYGELLRRDPEYASAVSPHDACGW
jgi:tRNA dimethylallyltransferase